MRAAASLSDAYLRQRDRVGLLRFGGDIEWIIPGSGLRQQYRIADALLESELARTYRWHDTSLIPRRILPPQSLIVALTPRLDWRVTRALLNLRRRGYQVSIVEVDPLPYLADAEAAAGPIAWRTWLLERDAVRTQPRRRGDRARVVGTGRADRRSRRSPRRGTMSGRTISARRRRCGARPWRRPRCARDPLRRRRPRLEHSAPRRRRPHLLRARLSVRGPAPDAAVERPAVTAVLVGRLLVAALLAFAGATVALLAAAVPARHGLATGLLGAAAAAALFLLVAAVARRGGEAEARSARKPAAAKR